MDMQIAFFQALADPTRLRIVEAMKLGECAVAEIVERVDIQQSGVSRHLRILHEAGIVTVRPEGQRRIYALRHEPFAELDAWTREYRKLWEGRLDRFGAELERRRAAQPQSEPKETP
jgi:DNA-binding transcriptional ArsR family regulator